MPSGCIQNGFQFRYGLVTAVGATGDRRRGHKAVVGVSCSAAVQSAHLMRTPRGGRVAGYNPNKTGQHHTGVRSTWVGVKPSGRSPLPSRSRPAGRPKLCSMPCQSVGPGNAAPAPTEEHHLPILLRLIVGVPITDYARWCAKCRCHPAASTLRMTDDWVARQEQYRQYLYKKSGNMARKKRTDDAMMARILAGEAARLADLAVKSLAAAQELGIENKPLVPFPLNRTERTILVELSALPDQLRKKLAGRAGKFAAAEVIKIVTAAAQSRLTPEPERQRSMLEAARRLLYCIHSDLLMPAWRAKASKLKPTGLLYQLKITLLGAKPAIWRRIQVRDCTLDLLHKHIQTTMGWTNSHLHHFEVDGQLYGDPQLMGENLHEMNYRDSTIALLSQIIPKDQRLFRFRYEYDFGDSWEHGVLFEGCPNPSKGQKYPVCLEGERACPPEDVGGVSGYAEFLKTIKDRDRRERVQMLEWAEGWFDHDEFDAATATKSMWKGILDWRSME